MGDYPLLINGSRAGTDDDGTSMVAVTGYNPTGALNGVVVDAGLRRPSARGPRRAASISASVGSAGHGTLVQALDRTGIDPNDDVQGREPGPQRRRLGAPGRLGRRGRAVRRLAGPARLPRRRPAGLRRRPARPADPARHRGPQRVRRRAGPRSSRRSSRRQIDATELPARAPAGGAQNVADATGLPAEVVYLYNGRNGVSTFDTTIKQEQVDALEHDVPFLKSIGVLDRPARPRRVRRRLAASGRCTARSTPQASTSAENPAAITGRDEVCDEQVDDPAAGRRALGRRRGRHPARRRPRPACCATSTPPRPTAATCARRTSRTR